MEARDQAWHLLLIQEQDQRRKMFCGRLCLLPLGSFESSVQHFIVLRRPIMTVSVDYFFNLIGLRVTLETILWKSL